MRTTRTLLPIFVARIALALSVAACEADPPKRPSDELTAVPFPTTIELEGAELAALSRSKPDGTLEFDTAPPALNDVKVGSILVASASDAAPAGLLRAVLKVERSGSGLTLRTAQVPIQLAYKKLHVRFVRGTKVANQGTAATQSFAIASGGGSYDDTEPFNYVLFDGDGDERTENDQIAVDGEIGGGFDYDFALDVDWGEVDGLPKAVTDCIESFANVFEGELPDCSIDALLPEAKVSFEVDPKVHANANVHGAALLSYEKEVDLTSYTLPPIVLGPIVFVPVVDLTAQLEGGASAAFRTGVQGSLVFESSVTVSSKSSEMPRFSAPKLRDADLTPNETSVTLHAEAKVGAGARLNLLLYGVTGPYATARAYGQISADALNEPCWSLHAGLDVDLGIKVTSPALPVLGHVTLVDWHAPVLNPFDEEIASGRCDAPPDAPTLPPGSGPDGTHLARPTFTPWSRTYSAPVDGSVAGSPGNSVTFADFQPTIDGGFVRAGFGVDTLTKLDRTGALRWARELTLDGSRLGPLRVRSSTDGALVVASSTATAQVVLTKLSQSGEVLEARAFDIPLDVCIVSLTALTSDGAGGFYVAGSCTGESAGFLLHVSQADTRFYRLRAPASSNFRINVAASIEHDAFISGSLTDGTDALFAMRASSEGKLVYGKRYTGCAEAPDAIPSQALVGALGEVTLAGSGGAQHNGIIIKLKADGSVGFASSPGFGFGVGSVFLLDSIAELPTTGYVAGGSGVRFTSEAPENVPSASLVGFDASGKLLWAKRYTFVDEGRLAPSGLVGVQLTDDGGVIASALVTDLDDALGGLLWTFEAQAKDGQIDFVDGAVQVTPLEINDLDCSLEASDLAIALEEQPVEARSVPVTSTLVSLTQAKQTKD